MRKSRCWIARHARHLLKEVATKSSRLAAFVSWLDNSPNKMFGCHTHFNTLFTRVLGSYYGEAGPRELWMIVSFPFLGLWKMLWSMKIELTFSCFIIKDVSVPSERSRMCPCAWLPSKAWKILKTTPPTVFRNSLPSITTVWLLGNKRHSAGPELCLCVCAVIIFTGHANFVNRHQSREIRLQLFGMLPYIMYYYS